MNTYRQVFYSQVFSVLVDVVEPEYVRVFDELHDGDLPLDLLQDGLGELVLVDDLDRDLLAQYAVGPELHQACSGNDEQ